MEKSVASSAVGELLGKVPGREPASGQDDRPQRASWPPRPARRLARPRTCLRKRKNVLGGGGLPGKLRDCISREMERCELYLVEGDSAGGSAEGGRLREYQAILPLRGKIINAYKSREDKVLANEEVQSMIQAIGIGIGDEQDIGQAPLQQDHHHDRRRRGRLAHPHAAAVLLLSADVPAGFARATSTSPSRRCSACAARRRPTTSRPKRR